MSEFDIDAARNYTRQNPYTESYHREIEMARWQHSQLVERIKELEESDNLKLARTYMEANESLNRLIDQKNEQIKELESQLKVESDKAKVRGDSLLAATERIKELEGLLDIKSDEYVRQVGAWKIIQRLEEQVKELEAEVERHERERALMAEYSKADSESRAQLAEERNKALKRADRLEALLGWLRDGIQHFTGEDDQGQVQHLIARIDEALK